MRVRDPEKAESIANVLLVYNYVLGPSSSLAITNDNNGYILKSGFRKVVVTPVRQWIKVK